MKAIISVKGFQPKEPGLVFIDLSADHLKVFRGANILEVDAKRVGSAAGELEVQLAASRNGGSTWTPIARIAIFDAGQTASWHKFERPAKGFLPNDIERLRLGVVAGDGTIARADLAIRLTAYGNFDVKGSHLEMPFAFRPDRTQ